MRPNFFRAVEDMAEEQTNIIVLTGDLGFKLFDNFQSRFPNRFYDVGVAEANMIGMASGLSLCGKNVYCYSIIPFLLMRAFEQIRMNIAYNNLSVKLVGVGGGLTYGLEGISHFGLEDLALMRMLPNMTIVVPACPIEAYALCKATVDYPGPLYIRLGRAGEPCLHDNPIAFEIGKPSILSEGKNAAIFAIGNMVYQAKQVIEKLKAAGITASLINMHTLQPLDKTFIQQVGNAHDTLFTIEEHYINGGLGTAVLEALSESGFKGRLERIGIPNTPIGHIGSQDHLRDKIGLSKEGLYKKILNILKER